MAPGKGAEQGGLLKEARHLCMLCCHVAFSWSHRLPDVLRRLSGVQYRLQDISKYIRK